MAAEAGSGSHRASPSFLNLPSETQYDIFSNCSQSDLICLALVSKHFHELASAVLYRNFHIVFPDEEESDADSPIDGLAAGLDTFTTSSYNYAKHLKDLSLDTLSAGDKGELSYQSYLYSASCGKFLNTLLYLTLKKAKALEAFRWNLRVELSRPVYQVLHRIVSLKKFHIRMQAGKSYYIAPPPLPIAAHSNDTAQNHQWAGLLTVPPELDMAAETVLSAMPPPIPSGPPASQATATSLPRSKCIRPWQRSKELLTVGGFRNLQSLSVLDIDNLDMVNELKLCVRNSSSTLTELQLSLSDNRGEEARKHPPGSEPDDSDVEEYVIPVFNPPPSAQSKLVRAQQERKAQEALLAKIFDVEPLLTKKPNLHRSSVDITPDPAQATNPEAETTNADPHQQFLASIKYVSKKLLTLINGSRAFSMSQQEILDTIEKAARKYVATSEVPTATAKHRSDAGAANGEASKSTFHIQEIVHHAAGSSSSKGLDAPASKVANNYALSTLSQSTEDAEKDESLNRTLDQLTLSPTRSKGKAVVKDSVLKDPNHGPMNSTWSTKGKWNADSLEGDDIDIAQMDGEEDEIDEADEQQVENEQDPNRARPSLGEDASSSQKSPAMKSSPPSPDVDRVMNNLANQKTKFEAMMAKLARFQDQADEMGMLIHDLQAEGKDMDSAQVRAAEAQLRLFTKCIDAIQSQIRVMEAEVEDLELQLPRELQDGTARRCMDEYIRKTRGFSLESLSLHLIPVKASVLSRAVDLRCLKQLTLLNVGNQAPIWALLAKENRIEPLPLRSIYTDHVSNTFLTFVSQLDEVHELFMLQRGPKYKPESTAPFSPTSIDQIRRLVLKKHMPTLKRLMVKDESSTPLWDANEKTMILICTRGKELLELAVSMNIYAVHAFMQYFAGLVKLRALNILRFRNSDTCIWVMREILRFIVDNLSHYPELKLTWIAMEDERVARVLRPAEMTEEGNEDTKRSSKSKGKMKAPMAPMAPMAPSPTDSTDSLPWLPTEGLESDSESDDDPFDDGARLRYKTVGPLRFYDVWGIKIFEKEIRSGRL